MMKIFWQITFWNILLLLTAPLSAQEEWKSIKIQGISLETIGQMVQDSQGVYYYPTLMEKFLDNQPLATIDYVMLYYGFVFSKNYNPYRHFALADSLGNLTDAQKAKEATLLADQLLAENPVSIFGNVEKAYVLNASNQKEKAYYYLERYRLLMQAMESSGEGSSYERAIVITNPKDAQAILLKYKLIELSKSINGRNGHYYDVYLVKNQKDKQYPIYFDITIPQSLGMDIFKQDPKE